MGRRGKRSNRGLTRYRFGRIHIRYSDLSFNNLFIGFIEGVGVDRVNWHFFNEATGVGGGFNYHVIPGRILGLSGRVKIAHSHYRRRGRDFIHISFFPEMSVSRAASIAVRGFLGVHRVFSRKGVESIGSGGFLKPLAEYLRRCRC